MKLPKYKYIYAFFDFIVIFVSFILAQYISNEVNYNKHIIHIFTHYSRIIYLISALIGILIFQFNNLYKVNIIVKRAVHFTSIIKSIFYFVLILVLLTFFIRLEFIHNSRLYIFTFTILSLFLFFWMRIIILRSLYLYFSKYDIIKRNAIIIGSGKSGKLLAAKLLFENSYGIRLLGFIDDKGEIDKKVIGDLKIIGKVSQITNLKLDKKINEVIIAVDNVEYQKLLEIIDICNRLEVNVKIISELFDIIPEKFISENYSGIPIINVSPRISIKLNQLFKSIFDIVGAFIAVIILSPLIIAIAITIRITSKGPVFFTQTRIGKNGKQFEFYKFRSMKLINGEDEVRKEKMIEFIKGNKSQFEGSFKIVNENRITKIGGFIRKYSLDELPQLFNVIKGDMSLVGPRPSLPYEYDNFKEWQKRRVAVLPGCTGVWQVSGRSAVSFDDSVILDLYYIGNMTPWLDIQIILKTLPVMLFARGGK